jgi:integrase
LEFTILNAARVGEGRGARWSEISLADMLWIVPPQRMKAGKQHQVPLADRALVILDEMAELRVSEFVFPGFWNNRSLGDATIRDVLRKLGVANATTHGFRSSFRDWCGDETSAAHDVIEAALAHAISNKTEAAYRRKDALEKRRALMQAWADYCGPASDKIISIHQHRGPSPFWS